MSKEKYWAVHGGSDSYFAAKNKADAEELVTMFNSVAKEYGFPESSRIEVVSECEWDAYLEALAERLFLGDKQYLIP